MPRLDVLKTYKLFIDGKFPRTESGRSWPVRSGIAARGKKTNDSPVVAHLCLASRKDLREAVEAARKVQPGWAHATAYNRGQILYRMAEMMEGKRRELEEAVALVAINGKKPTARAAAAEVEAAIDRLVCFAGWADKFGQELGCNTPVSGPFYNFTVPEATGVVAVLPPDEHPLLGLIALAAPALCAGNTVITLASEANPIPAAVLGEVCATSDVPGGVFNILTGTRDELVSFIAGHRDIDAIHAAGLPDEHATKLRAGAAENLKRVVTHADADFNSAAATSPWWIEPFVEMKTIWHPAAV